MATAYYSPGVYIEEVDKGPKPIQGVSTSITAFVGITEKAELVEEDAYTTRSLLSEAKLITNWTQYENHFGGFHEKGYLPYAVRGFFDNGGGTAWVVSIHALHAHAAQALIYAENPRDKAKPGLPSLLIHAREPGPLGETIKVSILRNGSTPAADSKGDGTAPKGKGGKPTESAPAGPSGAEAGPTAEAGGSAGAASSTPPKNPPPTGQASKPPLAEDQFVLRVEMDGQEAKEYTVRLDDLPLWSDRPAQTEANHHYDYVKVWSLNKPKSAKLAERMPKATDPLQLLGGAAKFDLTSLPEANDRDLLNGSPTLAQEADVLSRNAVPLFNGNPTRRKGAGALEALDNLNLICAPDLVFLHKEGVIDDQQLISVQKNLLTFCQKTQYRFAILDAPYSKKLPEDILAWKQNTDQANFDSMHGALYYPWLKITDPLTGRSKEIPPSGHMAGIYARSDTTRGVHKAPANEQVMGPVTSVTINVTKGEQDLLNPVGINCIRAFPGRGIRVWGARTLTSDPAWRYINVRRIFNYVEESVERSTQWVVFEPNDYFLWARVRRDITAFLRTVWVSGALFGRSAEEAFYVKCDEELNPQEIRDQGIMICEIGLAPVKPAEFVVFRFSQYAQAAG